MDDKEEYSDQYEGGSGLEMAVNEVGEGLRCGDSEGVRQTLHIS